MSTILQQARQRFSRDQQKGKARPSQFPQVVQTSYTSLDVDYPKDFLAPLPDPSKITVERIDFKNSPLNEYRNLYAVVLDNVLTREECDQLLTYAEMSKGAHTGEENEPADNGWAPAMVNAGRNAEVLVTHYRNSDRIIWDEQAITKRLWQRVLQGEGMKEYFSCLYGEKYAPAIGTFRNGEKWKPTKYGLNERMRFLRYGPGQFFKEHCDGRYETPDGSQRSFYTFHLYLNDSAQALDIKKGSKEDTPELLHGGATTFHSADLQHRLDVDPKIGRILIFQHRRLFHSGDLVTQGIKYTMRTDLMFEYDDEDKDDDDNGVVFG
ncbi:hypothetical protein EG329_000020 [Mollisiaceae sp. DMI_Dod_QoI]|nr:hypothetical protein EG329_000020 [Helotiales sp. DMI_Dod_QoI]